jgi:hypothetical protein
VKFHGLLRLRNRALSRLSTTDPSTSLLKVLTYYLDHAESCDGNLERQHEHIIDSTTEARQRHKLTYKCNNGKTIVPPSVPDHEDSSKESGEYKDSGYDHQCNADSYMMVDMIEGVPMPGIHCSAKSITSFFLSVVGQ